MRLGSQESIAPWKTEQPTTPNYMKHYGLASVEKCVYSSCSFPRMIAGASHDH
jgi:hypothetical protein